MSLKDDVRQQRQSSGTIQSHVSGFPEPEASLLKWYFSNKHTLNKADRLHGYPDTELSTVIDLTDEFIKAGPEHWMNKKGHLLMCLEALKRHSDMKGR